MQSQEGQERLSEQIRQEIIREEGWFVPTLHEKYLRADHAQTAEE
jgi:hypothetical protein